jgi:hypothetical protein
MLRKKHKTEAKTDKLPEPVPEEITVPDPDLAGHTKDLSEEQKAFVKKEKQAERDAEAKRVAELFVPFDARIAELKGKALTAGSIKRTLVDPIKKEVLAKGFKLDGQDPLNYQISW